MLCGLLKKLAEGDLGRGREEGRYCLSFATLGTVEWVPVMFMTIVHKFWFVYIEAGREEGTFN